MSKSTTALALAVLLFVAPVVVSFAQDSPANDKPLFVEVWDDYIVAKKRLQTDLAKLLTDKWPDLKGIAALNKDQQFALIEKLNMKFLYLVEHDPGRIVLDDGMSVFSNFAWAESDTDKLRETDPKFAKLETWIAEIDKAIAEHPKRDGIHARVLELMKDEVYRSMTSRYQKRLDQLAESLVIAAREAREERED
jgi:hypothetical protein